MMKTREQVMALESYFLSEICSTMGKEKGDILDKTYDHYVSRVRRNYRIEPSKETRHTACCKGDNSRFSLFPETRFCIIRITFFVF